MRALLRDPEERCWIEYRTPQDVLQANTTDAVATVLEQAERRALDEGLHAVGFVSYEAAAGLDPGLVTHPPGSVPCAWFGLFRHGRAVPDPVPAAHLDLDWQPSLDGSSYAAASRRIHAWIAAGDTCQVNFSYRLRARLPADPGIAGKLFRSMVCGRPLGLGAFIETGSWAVCCASPELFFERRGRRVTSRPMKGSAPRAADPDEDAEQARWLHGSTKNRAENLMITDMVRNDLGRVAQVGSVATGAPGPLASSAPMPPRVSTWRFARPGWTNGICARREASI